MNISEGMVAIMNISVSYDQPQILPNLFPTNSNNSQTMETPFAALKIAKSILASEDTVLDLSPFIQLQEWTSPSMAQHSYVLEIEVESPSLFRTSFTGVSALSSLNFSYQGNVTFLSSMSLTGSAQAISNALSLLHYLPLPNWNGRTHLNATLRVLNTSCQVEIACPIIAKESAVLWVAPVDDHPVITINSSSIWGENS